MNFVVAILDMFFRLIGVNAGAHHPLIKFLGKRTYPSAPVELKQRFADFVKKFESSEAISEKSTDKAVFSEFWEAPERFWRRDIEDAEITAILSGGASLH
ncbi:hypothetical protein L208DRAFT_52495 [Tricholoma matsutake]|nr:hypothetical protein L208DRAFT_52495 [Tricholoma matsutake 945]